MEHIDEKVEFDDVEIASDMCFDPELASDPDKCYELKQFVKHHYSVRTDDFIEYWRKYQSMISSAIKSNNLKGLNILWDGIYYHDRDNTHFEYYVYTAAEFGNLATFQHVLYGYWFYAQLDYPEELNYEQLIELASKNLDNKVLSYIEIIKGFIKQDNFFDSINPIESPPEIYFDQSLAIDRTKLKLLKQYVLTYCDDFEGHYEEYQKLITEAIKSHNLEALDILWKGIYFTLNPDFEYDTYTAAEFGDINMFKYIINGHWYYPRREKSVALNYERLINLALKNPDPEVSLYIKTIEHSV